MPKITAIEIVSCDAGWRNYHFCKLTCGDGTIGWSEFDEAFGAPGVGTIITRLATRVIGYDVTYEYGGRQLTDYFQTPPNGDTIRIRINTMPSSGR